MIDFVKRFIHDPNWIARDTFNKVLDADGYFDIHEIKNLDKFGEQAFYRNELMRLLRDKGNAKKIITFAMMSKIDHRVLYYLVHVCGHNRALEVMKDGSWKFNNLDYQYHYEIFGYGFNSASYYQRNQIALELDIIESNEDSMMRRLGQDIDQILEKNPNGVSFGYICEQTIERHPTKRSHCCKYLKLLQDAKEITIYKNGKEFRITENTKISNKDMIKRSYEKTLFSLRPFIKQNT